MNAALGGVSAGGLGTPLSEVTQRGGGPSAFVANQSAGNAGGTTLSKFSRNVVRRIHGSGHPPICAKIEPTAPPAATSKNKNKRFRNRAGVSVRLTFSTTAAGIQTLLRKRTERCQFFGTGSVRRFTEKRQRVQKHGTAPRSAWERSAL